MDAQPSLFDLPLAPRPPNPKHALCEVVDNPRPRLASPWAAPYPGVMPPRLRPTARFLTPAGWAGLAVLVLLTSGLAFAVWGALLRP